MSNTVVDPYSPAVPLHPVCKLDFSTAPLSGTGAPASTLGFTGDLYVDIATGNVYSKGNSGWAIATGGGGGSVGSAGTFKGGTVAIGNASTGAVVSGLALPGNPGDRFILTVLKPSGGLNIFASVVNGSGSAAGFTYTLDAQTDSASYVLLWVAAF